MRTQNTHVRLDAAPLRFRLPNPPAIFLGRDQEQQLLREAFRRAPATLVCGPGGIGKTSLVLSMLHGEKRTTLERVVCVSAAAADRSGEQLLRDLLLRLSILVGTGLGRLPSVSSEALLAQVVDLADACQAIVVLDDLHWMESALGKDLLATAGRYARKSQWVGTSRSLLPLDDEQTLVLSGLPEDALLSLTRSWAPELSDEQASLVAHEAGGSPFWLRQSLQQRHSLRGERSRQGLLSGLSRNARDWVERASWLEAPIPEEAIGLGVALDPEEIVALELSGLIERVAEGVRLHAVARNIVLDKSSGVDVALCQHLRESDSASLQLEALRIDLASGRVDEAATVAERAGLEWMTQGFSPQLWQLLENVHDARFLEAKLRCALDLGGGSALAWASEQAPPRDRERRLQWLEALAQSPHLNRASEDAASLAEELEVEAPLLAARAWLVVARANITLVRPETALTATEHAKRLASGDVGVEARAEVWAARALVFQGRTEEALSTCAALDEKVLRTDSGTRREVDEQRAAVYFNLGRSRRARDLFRRAERDGQGSLEQFGVRTRLVRGSLFALELGEMGEARRLLDELAPVAKRSEELLVFYAMNEFRYAAAIGELGPAEEHLSTLVEATSASNSGYWAAWIASPRHYLGILAGEPITTADAARDTDFPLTRALGAWHEVRSSGTRTRLSALPASDVIDAAIVRHLARANLLTIDGEAKAAATEARQAASLAEQEGLVLWGADALLVLAEAIAATGEGNLVAVLKRLKTLTRGLGATRYSEELRFFEEVARGGQADLATFDRLANGENQTAAVRRSRRILGFEAPADHVDSMICERVRGLLASPTVVATGRGERVALGLDTRRCRVLLPNGAVLELAKKPVAMKILLSLFESGGGASKESLVSSVWQKCDYHPLRDDKRLQVAIRRLRVLLGEQQWLETTEDGYRLAPDVTAYLA